MTWLVDPRHPIVCQVTETNRQQLRRVKRHAVFCVICTDPLTPDTAAFADGKDAHLHCAVAYNVAIEAGAQARHERCYLEMRQLQQAGPVVVLSGAE